MGRGTPACAEETRLGPDGSVYRRGRRRVTEPQPHIRGRLFAATVPVRKFDVRPEYPSSGRTQLLYAQIAADRSYDKPLALSIVRRRADLPQLAGEPRPRPLLVTTADGSKVGYLSPYAAGQLSQEVAEITALLEQERALSVRRAADSDETALWLQVDLYAEVS